MQRVYPVNSPETGATAAAVGTSVQGWTVEPREFPVAAAAAAVPAWQPAAVSTDLGSAAGTRGEVRSSRLPSDGTDSAWAEVAAGTLCCWLATQG